MFLERELYYFKNPTEWRAWLHENHLSSKGVELVFYRVGSGFESMRWEEAVQVAICYGWIDSTVKKLMPIGVSRSSRRVKKKVSGASLIKLISKN